MRPDRTRNDYLRLQPSRKYDLDLAGVLIDERNFALRRRRSRSRELAAPPAPPQAEANKPGCRQAQRHRRQRRNSCSPVARFAAKSLARFWFFAPMRAFRPLWPTEIELQRPRRPVARLQPQLGVFASAPPRWQRVSRPTSRTRRLRFCSELRRCARHHRYSATFPLARV